MKKTIWPVKTVKVRFCLVNEKSIIGSINIDGFNKVSDFLENSRYTHLKIFDVVIWGKEEDFIIVPKDKILYYCPMEE